MRKDPEILEFLRRNGLSVEDYHVLSFVHYGPQPPRRLVEWAARELAPGSDRLPRASEQDCGSALDSLLSRGVLQVIDDAALVRIEAILAASPAEGPLMGLPNVGEVDFTEEGGRLWRRLDLEVFDSVIPYSCGNGELNEDDESFRYEYLAATEQAVREAAASHLEDNRSEILSIEGPSPIGAWRCNWWDVAYPQGYRMVIVERPEPLPDEIDKSYNP